MATFARVPHPIARRSGAVFRRTPEVDRHVQPAAAVVAPPVRWSFADIPVTAPAPVGSTALDTDEQEGFIGQTDEPEAMDVPTPSSKKSPAPVPKAPPSGTPPTPGTPPAPTISSATVKTAPSGAANTRTDVGVGEVVDFTGSVAGTWTATGGTATGASSTKFRWTAPATAGSVTITLKAGAASATDTINVVAPKGISMKNVGSHTAQVGPGGACMLTEVTFKPLDVCLGSIQWLEVPGPATGFVGDYFKKFSAATLHHNPNTNYAVVDDNNVMEAGPKNAANDHCAVHTLPGPYKAGEFEWRIPNRYKLDSEADDKGRWFTDTTQHFAMTAAGDLTITKAGATT
jgi:hypothetical protein